MQSTRFGGLASGPSPLERRYLMSVVAREVLRDVARLLAAADIAVMPLKGVLFQLLLYADPAHRELMDVDVLVPQGDFERAIQVLIEAGFRPRSAGRSLVECALTSPRGMTVDLHRRLFSRMRYRLDTRDVFRRSRHDTELLGVPLSIAHPHDTAAHLVGKFVSDHEACDARARLAELSRWIEHCAISPRPLAAHLCACGMQRAARYAFGRGAELLGDPLFAQALAALPADPIGECCAALARLTLPWLGKRRAGALPAHLLNDSLLRAGASLTWSAVERARHAWLHRQQGAAGGYWSAFFSPRSQRWQTVERAAEKASKARREEAVPSLPTHTDSYCERPAPPAR
jgi:hypothetical protein